MNNILVVAIIIGLPSFWFLYKILKHDGYIGDGSFTHEGTQEICDEFDELLDKDE